MDVTGERIRKRRTALNISQAELAEQVGYKNKTTITKIESGKISAATAKRTTLDSFPGFHCATSSMALTTCFAAYLPLAVFCRCHAP